MGCRAGAEEKGKNGDGGFARQGSEKDRLHGQRGQGEQGRSGVRTRARRDEELQEKTYRSRRVGRRDAVRLWMSRLREREFARARMAGGRACRRASKKACLSHYHEGPPVFCWAGKRCGGEASRAQKTTALHNEDDGRDERRVFLFASSFYI